MPKGVYVRTKFGKDHHRWRGDKISCEGKHMWVRRKFGKPNKCENPKCSKKYTKYNWANISGEYKRERWDWIQLCMSCHRKMDRKPCCRHGHIYTVENSYFRPNGSRDCRLCRREHAIRYNPIRKNKGGRNEDGNCS